MTISLPPDPKSLETKKANISFFDVFRFAAGYWRRQPIRLGLCIVLFAAAAIVETNLPNSLSKFLATVKPGGDTHAIYIYLALFVGNYFLHVSLRSGGMLAYNYFETRVFKNLYDDTFAHVIRLSEQFFVNTFTGSIISKINRSRSRIENFEDQIFLRMMPTSVILIGSMAMLSLRFPLLAAIVASYLVIVLGASAALVVRFVGPSQAAYASAQDRTNAHLADSISGVTTTRAYAQELREIEGFEDTTEELRTLNHRAYLFSNVTGFSQLFLLCGMLVLLLGGGTWYFLHGKSGVEDIAYLTLAYTIIQSYLRDLSYNLKDLLTSSYDLHAVVSLMREQPGVKDVPHASPLVVHGGAIRFENVTFSYQGKQSPIFDGLSVSVKAGERVALVGHSGSGKTSFIRLVQRLYDIDGGAIYIDGANVRLHTQRSLRASIASVPQDPILFHRTLRENIAYGKPGATLEEIYSAAKRANIDAFIQTLPLKYETLVGERGVKLSGGERQRVAIARAILSDRPILILDEATSSLDSLSERAIQAGLQALTRGRTSIMIAHRLSTVLDADRILVFDQGKIVEEGSHKELIDREGGIYAELFKLQSGGFLSE